MVHPPDPGVGGGAGTVPEQVPDVQTSFVVPGNPSSQGVLSSAFVSAEQTPSVQTPATLHGAEARQTTPVQRSGVGVGDGDGDGGGGDGGGGDGGGVGGGGGGGGVGVGVGGGGVGVGGGVGGGGGWTDGGSAPQSSTGAIVKIVSPPTPFTSPSDCPPATAQSISNRISASTSRSRSRSRSKHTQKQTRLVQASSDSKQVTICGLTQRQGLLRVPLQSEIVQ
jgi:hypothetical protein